MSVYVIQATDWNFNQIFGVAGSLTEAERRINQLKSNPKYSHMKDLFHYEEFTVDDFSDYLGEANAV